MTAADALPMMPWFPRDFLAATRGWGMVEVGVYRSLLDAQWDLGSLPIDETALRKIISCDVREFKKGWKKCADKFPLNGSCRMNRKLEQHRQEAIRLRGLRSKGAATTNAKRRSQSESHSDTPSEALSGTHPSPSPSPSQTPLPPLEKGDARRRRSKRRSERDDAMAKWAALLTSGGKDRDERVQRAINAIGGWPRIAGRTDFEDSKLKSAFCDAYRAAQ